MFTITNKLRTIIAIGAAGAALAGSGVASAATVFHEPGTGTPVVSSQPTSVAQMVDPNKVFGVGNSGYSTEQCETLANNANYLNEQGNENLGSNDGLAYAQLTVAADDYKELTSNCGVMD